MFVERISPLNVNYKIEMLLCPDVRGVINKLPLKIKNELEEIRLRVNKPLMINLNNEDYFISYEGIVSDSPINSFIVSKKNIENTLQFVTNYSIYSVEEELKNGYVTVEGGHRVGIVGKVLGSRNDIRSIKDFSGLNIRISREKKGVSTPVLNYLINNGEFLNTLIISPPQCGKTTLLRDIIRNLSIGVPSLGFRGKKIGVVDERSEIGACFQGVPQNDLGPRTDILDSCPKAVGMMILIRAMSPHIIATDEIGRREDSDAIEEALLAGISLITTVHGKSIEDIVQRKVIGSLIERKVFKRIIVLSNSKGIGTIEKIIDGNTLNEIVNVAIKNKVG